MLTDEQIADGWIAHDGGECPVPPKARVLCILRRYPFDLEGSASFFRWSHDGTSTDIIAYIPENANG
jgi:hypothetical protein